MLTITKNKSKKILSYFICEGNIFKNKIKELWYPVYSISLTGFSKDSYYS